MTTTTEDIMKLAFNASHAETEHSADKWFAQLRAAVESLLAERDAAIAALGNPCLDECLKAANAAALRVQP